MGLPQVQSPHPAAGPSSRICWPGLASLSWQLLQGYFQAVEKKGASLPWILSLENIGVEQVLLVALLASHGIA